MTFFEVYDLWLDEHKAEVKRAGIQKAFKGLLK